MTLLKKYMETWYFLCTRMGVTNLLSRPSAKKNQGWSYPAKIHLRWLTFLIDILERAPATLCTFMETFTGVFMYCSPAKKTRKLNIWDWSLTSSSIYSVGDILQWIIFNTLYHLVLASCFYRCVCAQIKEIICPLGDGL